MEYPVLILDVPHKGIKCGGRFPIVGDNCHDAITDLKERYDTFDVSVMKVRVATGNGSVYLLDDHGRRNISIDNVPLQGETYFLFANGKNWNKYKNRDEYKGKSDYELIISAGRQHFPEYLGMEPLFGGGTDN